MSILHRSEIGWFISHLSYLKDLYKLDLSDEGLRNLDKLFDISAPFAVVKEGACKKKRKRKAPNIDDLEPTSLKEIEYVKEKSKIFLNKLKTADLIKSYSDPASNRSNTEAQEVAKTIYESYRSMKHNFNGRNDNSTNIITNCQENLCIFPPKCRFFNYDIRELDYKLIDYDSKFDVILMDPPWWNKYIRRKRKKCVSESYNMLYNQELLKFPMGQLLSEEGLILIWCTNAPSHIQELLEVLLPAWNVEQIATWHWLKITIYGETICPFSEPCQKQPYERIIIASRSQNLKAKFLDHDKKLILSVPSAIHSHKPPLVDILKELLPDSSRYLEVFARYLLPGWTSIGNEVLRLQCFQGLNTADLKT